MYYLQSRYYDATIGRFVNGDESSTLIMSNFNTVSYNIYSYCGNCLVISNDDIGLFSFYDIKNFLKKIFDGIKQRIEDYLCSLFVIKRRHVSINTDVFAVVINLILGLIVRSCVIKTFNKGLNFFKNTYLSTHTGKAVDIMKKVVDFFLESSFGKYLLKLIAKKVVRSAGLSTRLISTIAGGLLNDFISSKSKLAGKAWTVVSAFSSVGSIIAFALCDMPDGSIDGRLTIEW